MAHSIVPPYLLTRIAEADATSLQRAASAARRSLRADPALRAERRREGLAHPFRPAATTTSPGTPARTIFDAAHTELLPGLIVRREGDPAGDDPAVTEAYDGLGATHALLAAAFGRDSIDDRGLPLLATVHYGDDYDNAFWDGERMVFGDGDGEIFNRFTASLSVIGHELAHGVTQYTAALVYEGQSGALNESFSDVIGALVEQHDLGQTAGEAGWLIGEGLFTDAVEGRALRSMLEPGTAYDDDVLGRDPQPADMAGYIDTDDDNGGVHLNSGIPNRAFALAAIEIGGHAWEAAGRIWFDAVAGTTTAGMTAADTAAAGMTTVGTARPGVGPRATFADFAEATIASALALHGDDSAELVAVTRAWATVGVRSDERAA